MASPLRTRIRGGVGAKSTHQISTSTDIHFYNYQDDTKTTIDSQLDAVYGKVETERIFVLYTDVFKASCAEVFSVNISYHNIPK